MITIHSHQVTVVITREIVQNAARHFVRRFVVRSAISDFVFIGIGVILGATGIISRELAMGWIIAKGVVVNPSICFGQPVIEAKGIPTHVISQAARANGNDLSTVADWYGMTVAQVRSAVQFETRRAA